MKKLVALVIVVLIALSCAALADWDITVNTTEGLRWHPVTMKLVPADNLEGEAIITIEIISDENCLYECTLEDDAAEAWFIGADGYAWDADDETAWTVTKDGAEYVWVIEGDADAIVAHVVSLPEDEENGEIEFTAMNDWTWDFTVERDEGVDGTFKLNCCPDLGWGWNADMVDRFCDKEVVVDKDTTEFTAAFFVPSAWVVDQTQSWYLWSTDARLNGIGLEFIVTSAIEDADGTAPTDLDVRGAVTLKVHKLVLE